MKSIAEASQGVESLSQQNQIRRTTGRRNNTHLINTALMLVIDYKLEPGKALKMVDDVSSRNVACSF
jgi:hypothetical protein